MIIFSKTFLVIASVVLVTACSPRKYAKQPRSQPDTELALYNGQAQMINQNHLQAQPHSPQNAPMPQNIPPYANMATGSISSVAAPSVVRTQNIIAPSVSAYPGSMPYRIEMGDTIYGIARKFSMSPRDIKIFNNMLDPDNLKIGQVIYLPQNKINSTGYSQRTSSLDLGKVKKTPLKNTHVRSSGIFFNLPKNSRIIQDFDASGEKFVKVLMPHDTKIKASITGEVIFVGNIKNYGKLVLVQHENDYISNFAQLGKVYVTQGQKVGPGDVIAQGQSQDGMIAEMIYELRKDTQIINPTKYIS